MGSVSVINLIGGSMLIVAGVMLLIAAAILIGTGRPK